MNNLKEIYHIFYKVTYLKDGKYYYGTHTGRLDDKYRGSNKVIHSIKKLHGIKFLIRENLKLFKTREDALKFEDRFLKLYNLRDDPNSFNFKNSANGGDTWSHMTDGEKLKRKKILSSKLSGINNGNFGKPMPEDAKRKMIESKIGVSIHSEEYKKKLSERLKSEWASGNRTYILLSHCDNRKGKKNGDEWNQNISEGVKNSEKFKEGLKTRSENKIEKTKEKLSLVKRDLESGMEDQEIMDKYKIKSVTLYSWKTKIKKLNL